MNRHDRRANGIHELRPPPSMLQPPQDPRMERAKMVVVDISFLATLLRQPNEVAWRFDGWPEGAQYIAHALNGAQLVLFIYREDFPRRLAGVAQEMIVLNAHYTSKDQGRYYVGEQGC